jgi:hypothetical protein
MDRLTSDGAGRGASHDPLGENSPSPEELPGSILLEEAEERRKTAKRLATAAAQMARLGAQVHKLESGRYLVSCGNYTRTFGDVETLAKFAANPGARE